VTEKFLNLEVRYFYGREKLRGEDGGNKRGSGRTRPRNRRNRAESTEVIASGKKMSDLRVEIETDAAQGQAAAKRAKTAARAAEGRSKSAKKPKRLKLD
jgi:hypothetical protein